VVEVVIPIENRPGVCVVQWLELCGFETESGIHGCLKPRTWIEARTWSGAAAMLSATISFTLNAQSISLITSHIRTPSSVK
jgi:hypothetical protein